MPAIHRIDLNADVGEGFGAWRIGDDAALIEVVSSANIACGFHAGDPLVLRDTVRRAAQGAVAIGAHPGWPDLWGFGRRTWSDAGPDETQAIVLYQLGAFGALCRADGLWPEHVKLHGALAGQTAADPGLAAAAARAIATFEAQAPAGAPRLHWTVMPGTAQERACRMAGLRPLFEGYVDRSYAADGSLVARGQAGAVLTDPVRVAERAVEMVRRQALPTVKGTWIPAQIDTLCLHGDTPNALQIACAVRDALARAEIAVAAPNRAVRGQLR